MSCACVCQPCTCKVSCACRPCVCRLTCTCRPLACCVRMCCMSVGRGHVCWVRACVLCACLSAMRVVSVGHTCACVCWSCTCRVCMSISHGVCRVCVSIGMRVHLGLAYVCRLRVCWPCKCTCIPRSCACTCRLAVHVCVLAVRVLCARVGCVPCLGRAVLSVACTCVECHVRVCCVCVSSVVCTCICQRCYLLSARQPFECRVHGLCRPCACVVSVGRAHTRV